MSLEISHHPPPLGPVGWDFEQTLREEDGAQVRHVTCHNDDVALCGKDVSTHEWSDDLPVEIQADTEECTVCVYYEENYLACVWCRQEAAARADNQTKLKTNT